MVVRLVGFFVNKMVIPAERRRHGNPVMAGAKS
jgi:hypothetical protein